MAHSNLSYIHDWGFTGRPGTDFVIPNGVTKIDDDTLALKLVANPSALAPGQPVQMYTVANDVFIRTGAFSPDVKLEWGFIQLFGETDQDNDGTDITTLDVRIYDGTNSRYWGGATWDVVADNETDWNTLAILNTNLASYTGSSLAIEVRLRTTDKNYTPTLSGVRLKWTGKRISFYREWVVETVLSSIADNIRPLTDYPIKHSGGDIVALTDHPLDADWTITDIVSVYNHDDDPDHLTDLFSSFDSDEELVTLTSSIDLGTRLWIVAEYAPQVAVTTSSDYLEGGKTPAVLLTMVNPTWDGKSIGATGPVIIDTTTSPPAGTVFPHPVSLVDIDFVYATVAPTTQDLIMLNEAMSHWLDAHPILRSSNLDQSVKMYPGSFDWNTSSSDVKDPRIAVGTFVLRNVPIIGDPASGAADGLASKRIGPVDAGDPNAPGVGYGVERMNTIYKNLATGGED